MADEGEKIQVKTLKNTDLKAEDISKAIDATVAKSVAPKADETKPEPPAKTTKQSSAKAKTESKSRAADSGAQIVVKKRGTYVGGTAVDQPQVKPAEPTQEKEAKTGLKAPSELGKTVAASVKEPATTPSSSVATAPPAETKIENPSPAKPAEDSKPAAEQQAETPSKASAEPKPAKVETVPAQQALKTFDTNEYHLPIKLTAGNHYMNRGLSWTILLLVLFGVGGYVLVELGVINPTDFGF